jgi:hypothetical protein
LFFPILFAAIALVNAEYREGEKTSTVGHLPQGLVDGRQDPYQEYLQKAYRHIALFGAALCSFPERINSAFALYSVGE